MIVKIAKYVLSLFLIIMTFVGCSTYNVRDIRDDNSKPIVIAPLSKGLPEDGLWRQNIVLYDVNGDGFLDIIAPPPRIAPANKRHPHVFIWNNSLSVWEQDAFTFPLGVDYDYGSIAVGDINKDGYFDLVLAQHSGNIRVLLNNGKKAFYETSFPLKESFKSRSVILVDINNDGRLDIVAVSEAPFNKDDKPKGIIIAINRHPNDWDISIVEKSLGLFSDSLVVGDINGDGNLDLAIAPHTSRAINKRVVWFGNGKGGFEFFEITQLPERTIPVRVGLGDLAYEGRSSLIMMNSGIGANAKVYLSAYRWQEGQFVEISSGLDIDSTPYVFTMADIDKNNKDDLIVLSEKGLHLLRYENASWVQYAQKPLQSPHIGRTYGIAAGTNSDGSVVLVYNLADNPERGQGLRAYRVLIPKKR